MKRFDVCGLGNGIADIMLDVSEEEFSPLGFTKGGFALVDHEQQQKLLTRFSHKEPVLTAGGSVANSVIAISQLGGKSAFQCCLGDDSYGLFYKNEFDTLGIEVGNPIIVGHPTGTCVVLITPDAERTMRTCLGISSSMSDKHLNADVIRESRWLFIEGYLFSNPGAGPAAVSAAIELARSHDCRVAITFSDEFIVHACGDLLKAAVNQADLIFANEREACAFTGTQNYRDAFRALKNIVPNAVVTAGARGVLVRFNGEEASADAFPCRPVDLTGAGDMLAGAFLYGITHGYSPHEAARGGCYLAMEVISRQGARLHSGVKEFWDLALAREA